MAKIVGSPFTNEYVYFLSNDVYPAYWVALYLHNSYSYLTCTWIRLALQALQTYVKQKGVAVILSRFCPL